MTDPARERTLTSLAESYITERLRRGEFSLITVRNVRGNLYRFAEACGNRPVSRLSRSDVERWLSSRPQIAVATQRWGRHGGGVLPISDETWMALTAYLSEHPATSGGLVRSYRQEWRALQADTISGMVSLWMSEAGIKRRPRDGVNAHALRHTSATDMLRAGAHLRDVQHALGHAHLATTEVYLPLVVKDLREAMGGRKYRGAGA